MSISVSALPMRPIPPTPVTPAVPANRHAHAEPQIPASETGTVEDELSGQALGGRLREGKAKRSALHPGQLSERMLADEAEGRITRLKQRMSQEAGSWEEMLALLKAEFADISDQVAALRWLLEDPELEERYRNWLREVERALLRQSQADGQTRSLKAGLNTVTQTRLASQQQGLDAQKLRDCYRTFLAADIDALGRYEDWIETFGFDKRMAILAFVEEAITADMYALDPSCSHLEFGNVLRRIGELRQLRSTDSLVCTRCVPESTLQRIGWEKVPTLLRILQVVREGQGTQLLLSELAAAAVGRLSVSELMQLLQCYRRTWRAIPESLWPHPKALLQANLEMDLIVSGLSQSEPGAPLQVFNSV